MAVATHRPGGSRKSSRSPRLELLEDRSLPSAVLLDAPPMQPDPPGTPAELRDHPAPELYGKGDRAAEITQQLLAAADKPTAAGDSQPPAGTQQPGWTTPDGSSVPAPMSGNSLPASDSGQATSGDSGGDPASAPAAPLRMTDAVNIGDAQGQQGQQGQQGSQTWLGSFTSPPDTSSSLVASPQPLRGDSLAVVATLLTGPEMLPAEEGMPSPAATAPAIMPLPAQATGGEDAAPFLVGVQEGLESSLAVERERLVNVTQPAAPGLAQPVVVNVPLPALGFPTTPATLAPRGETAPGPAIDPRQTRADTAPQGSLSPAPQLPAAAAEVNPDAFSILTFTEPAGEQFVSTAPAGALLLTPDPALPETGAANETAAVPRPAAGLLVAAAFTAGLTYCWWTDALAGTSLSRLCFRGRRRRTEPDRR